MAAIEAEKLNFTYPDADRAALSDVTFSIPSGGFYLLMGPSGSGKSTLLRLLQGEIAPHGALRGQLHCDSPAGFVFQNPQDSLVTDSVQRELAFSPEHAGLDGAAGAGLAKEKPLHEALDQFSTLVTLSLEGSMTTADAMRARGYGKGRRRVYDPFTFGVADGVELAVVLLLSITVLAITGRAAPRFSLLFSMTLGCIARFRENARQGRPARAGGGLA